MDEVSLVAHAGRPTGSRAANRLRHEGKVPAVVYGEGIDAPLSVAVDARELRLALHTEAGANALVNLRVDGSEHLTMMRQIQRDPVRRSVSHVDFVLVNRDVAVEVDVPIHLVGEAEMVEREQGMVEQVLNSLTVSCKPTDIPADISVDISNLTIGDTVKVGDLPLPPGVETSVDPDEAVATAQVSRATLEAEALEAEAAEAAEEAAEEGAAPAEGEAAEAPAPADSSDAASEEG